MGIDAYVFSVGIPDIAQIDDLVDRLLDGTQGRIGFEVRGVPFELADRPTEAWDPVTGVLATNLDRLWGPRYERGSWPLLSTVIETWRAVFGHVYYCGDSYDVARPFTLDDSREYWDYWRSPHWDDYHRRAR